MYIKERINKKERRPDVVAENNAVQMLKVFYISFYIFILLIHKYLRLHRILCVLCVCLCNLLSTNKRRLQSVSFNKRKICKRFFLPLLPWIVSTRLNTQHSNTLNYGKEHRHKERRRRR